MTHVCNAYYASSVVRPCHEQHNGANSAFSTCIPSSRFISPHSPQKSHHLESCRCSRSMSAPLRAVLLFVSSYISFKVVFELVMSLRVGEARIYLIFSGCYLFLIASHDGSTGRQTFETAALVVVVSISSSINYFESVIGYPGKNINIPQRSSFHLT